MNKTKKEKYEEALQILHTSSKYGTVPDAEDLTEEQLISWAQQEPDYI